MDEGKRFWIREPFCGLSHGLGACLAFAAVLLLLLTARGSLWPMVAVGMYGVSLIGLYTISALYHSLWLEMAELDRLQRFDHIAIFLFIAGSYAPLCLISLRGPIGWGLFGTECILAILGIMCSDPRRKFPDWARVAIYIIMGWLGILALAPLREALSPEGFAWLLASGLAYTIGAIIFAADRPHLWPGRFNAHDLWHLFVLAGSACHYVVLARYVLPRI